jgi:hypothetical protein
MANVGEQWSSERTKKQLQWFGNKSKTKVIAENGFDPLPSGL